jgi:hypothetical protein
VVPPNTDQALNTTSLLMKNYATNGLRINLTACPQDFADAYTRVFNAWQKKAEVVAAHPHVPDGSGPIVEGFFRNMDQDVIDTMSAPPEGMTDWFDQVTEAEDALHTAEKDVQSLLIKYGVRPSQE